MIDRQLFESHWHFLRRIPVDFQLAPETVMTAIRALEPEITVCCGMAENQQKLSLESNGKREGEILKTGLALERLLEGTIATEISYDAGNFVCNHLYYSVLNQFAQTQHHRQCLFVHVPVLTTANLECIVHDFSKVMQHLQTLAFSNATRLRFKS
jgi:pyroglutamyl-peptidase